MFKKSFQLLKTEYNSLQFIRLHFKVHSEKSFIVIENEKLDKIQSIKFPKVWLRDNCQCEECFHKGSHSRKIDWVKFNVNVDVKNVKIDSKVLDIEWEDHHKSQFHINWLKARDFSESNRKNYLQSFYRLPTVHWGKKNFKNICHEYQYKDVMENNKALRMWLESLAINGAAIIKNAPIERNIVKKLIDRVAFIKKTHYGEEFIVQAKPDTKNYAYLSTPLQMHTDLPYYEYKPGVNILHCLVQSHSTGGCNLLADGFYVADRLEKEYPKDFQILTEVLVDWNDIGQEEEGKPFHSIFRSPVICLGRDEIEKYTRINHSVPQRDSHFSVDIDQVIPWYHAFAKFVKILYEEAVTFKTTPGDILTFNNIRCVHGRTGYEDEEDNVRFIVGGYLDWDVIYASLRTMLKENEI